MRPIDLFFSRLLPCFSLNGPSGLPLSGQERLVCHRCGRYNSRLIGGETLGYDRHKVPVGPEPNGPGIPPAAEQEAEMEHERPEEDTANRQHSERPQVPRAETRQERIERIRAEIEAGTYETPEKLDAALDRLMGVLADS